MNLATYERGNIAAWYGKLDGLFAAERVIAELVVTPATDMVDVGIGGGRTTKHLAHRCRSYLGFDYAASMVTEARRTCAPGLNIIQADATDMRDIPDASADFVLFSFNGIDSVSPAARLRILRECRRICRPGAYFAFSSHNLTTVPREFARKPGLKGLARWLLIQALNFPLGVRIRADFAVLNDGVHRFGLKLYYVKPKAQIAQLVAAGFSSPRLFDFNSGIEIVDEEVGCPFPYYLCVAA
jgi:ubiquinone/menaquinone biosynthesis C-methylase UbiE